jgi:hypothetical protein
VRAALGRWPDGDLAWCIGWVLRPYDMPVALTGEWWEWLCDDYETLTWVVRRSRVLGLSVPPLAGPRRAVAAQLVAAQSAVFNFLWFAAGEGPPQYKPPYQVRSAFLRTDAPPRLRRALSGPLEAQILEAVWALLSQARDGYERVRICALPTCGRLFLAARRTRRYCSRAHASLAGVRAFRKRKRTRTRRR